MTSSAADARPRDRRVFNLPSSLILLLNSLSIGKARPFKSVNELTNVTGIGPSKFATLKSHVVVKARNLSAAKEQRDKASGVASSAGTATEKPAARTSTGASSAQREKSSTAPSSAKPSPSLGQKVNINTATLEELESLSGIGHVRVK